MSKRGEMAQGPSGHRPIPQPIAYPADYGLAVSTQQLICQYGTDGAVNRLIEMAERLSAGEDPLSWVMRRRRVDPTAIRAAMKAAGE